MKQKIFCLMTSGACLSDEACDALFYMALAMFNEKDKRRAFRAEDCEGEIATDFRHASIGDIAGMVFEAKVEVGTGSKKTVRYIVRTHDLEGIEKGAWSPWTRGSRPQRRPAFADQAMLN